MRARLLDLALLVLVVVVAAAVTAPLLAAPFDGSAESWGGAFYGTAARNLLRYGPRAVRGAMVVQAGPVGELPAAYANHPPLVAWLVALSFSLLGEGEWQARLVPWLLSLGAAGGLFGLLRRAGAEGVWAAAGALLAVGTPMWARYGAMVDPQGSGPLAAMVLLALVATLPAGAGRGLLLALVALPGLLFDWPVTGAALAVAAWLAWTGGRRAAAGLVGLVAAVLAGLAAWTAGLPAVVDLIADPLATGVRRAALGAVLAHDDGTLLTRGQVWATILAHHRAMVPLHLTLGGLAGAAWLGAGAWRGRLPRTTALLLIPGAVGLAHVVVFSQGAAVHRFWQVYLGPGAALVLAGALGAALPVRWRRPLGGLALVAALALCLRAGGLARTWARAPGRTDLRRVGTVLKQHTPADSRLASGQPRQVVVDWYADRPVRWGADAAGAAWWDGVLDRQGGPLAETATARFGPPMDLPLGWGLWLPR